MVLNCHRERTFLLTMQPHLTKWLPIAVPMDRWLLWPPPFGYPPAALGPLGLFFLFFKFYDALCGFQVPPSHVMSRSRTRRKFPQLSDRVNYCVVFYEGQHNDSRTALALALTAVDHGASAANHLEVTGLLYDGDHLQTSPGRVVGVRCIDKVAGGDALQGEGASFDVRGKTVVLCGGPFTDEIRRLESKGACLRTILP